MRLGGALLLTILAAGCGEKRAEPPLNAIATQEAPEFVRDPGPKPHLVSYRPPNKGGPEAFRMAVVAGVLDFSGRCIRLQGYDGSLRTLVTSAGSGLKRDSLGWFLPSGRDRLRHGASVEGGGGALPSLPPADLLANAAPAECARGPAVELIGAHRFQPLQGTIDEPPPPTETPPPPPPPPS